MKKVLLAICGGALLFAGCKEHDAPIDFGTTASVDTTYVVSPVPAADKHQVLVEEFTGQSCANCPAAHADLDAISAKYAGYINVVSMYITASPQTEPPSGAKYDFRDPVATTLAASSIYNGVGAWPSAGIDRTPANGTILQIGSGSWDGIITNQLNVTDSLNLSVACSYDSAAKKATITTMVTYTQPVSTPQNLTVVIVEDSIYDKQEDGTAASGYDDNFLFLDVFRGMVTTAPFGDPLQVNNGNVKEAGRFFQHQYAYSLPTSILNPAHCRVVAFVDNTNGTDLHVMQSAQCNLTVH